MEEKNPILIEHETNKLYEVYKDVKTKTETAKTAYIDLTDKIKVLQGLHDTVKSKLDTILKQISDEKVAWAGEKEDERRKIEEKTSSLDNALRVKTELNKQQEDIRVSIAKEIEIREETRRLDLKVKADKDALDAERIQFEKEKKVFNLQVSKHEQSKKDFKDKITNLITNFE